MTKNLADNKLPDETQTAIEYLVRTAKKEGVLIAGFAICDDEKHMAVMNFGTDSRFANNLEFYREACALTQKKIEQGNVVKHNLSEVV